MTWRLPLHRRHHPGDDRLIAVALAASTDAPSAEAAHAAECPHCARRLRDLRAFLDGVAERAAAEADGGFPLERLLAQRQRIARRLERLAGIAPRARVLPFPGGGLRPGAPAGLAHRWVAAAAIGGLVVGLTTGWLAHFHPSPAAMRTQAVVPPDAAEPAMAFPGDATPLAIFSEDAFLAELDAALATTRVAELRAIDELTPRIQEIAVNIR